METTIKTGIAVGLLIGSLVVAICVASSCSAKKVTAPAAAPSATAVASDACDVQLARCMKLWNEETAYCSSLSLKLAASASASASAKPAPIVNWLATGDASAFAAPSASPSVGTSAPAAGEWKPVDDLDTILGTWVDHEHGDYSDHGELVMGGVRVIFKKNGKKAKTPYSVAFYAPRPGHDNSKTVAGGCGFYKDLHDAGQVAHGQVDLTPGWRAAYCTGYDRGDSIATHLVMDTDGKRLRFDLDNWLLVTLVRQ